MTSDYTGSPLGIGDRVEAWLDLIRYEGTVTEIKRPDGSGYRWITVRSDDGDLHETFSDAVRVIRVARGVVQDLPAAEMRNTQRGGRL